MTAFQQSYGHMRHAIANISYTAAVWGGEQCYLISTTPTRLLDTIGANAILPQLGHWKGLSSLCLTAWVARCSRWVAWYPHPCSHMHTSIKLFMRPVCA